MNDIDFYVAVVRQYLNGAVLSGHISSKARDKIVFSLLRLCKEYPVEVCPVEFSYFLKEKKEDEK